ncbi:MAG: cobalamin B12-binding domain-containing protein [Clostridia bacterium]|nr:cobalamin B12-binding domain-containing protein [Clostridia bacterium]
MARQAPVRILIAKPGLDGHDRGAKVVAKALMEAGLEVIYSGLHQSIDQIAHTAVQEDVEVVGLSVLSNAHVSYSAKLLKKLRELGAEDIKVVVGGNVPNSDEAVLKELGVAEVFGSAPLERVITWLNENCGK